MGYSLPGSSVRGIFQARVLEWGAIAFSDQWPYTKMNKKLTSNSIKSNEKLSWVWKTYGNMVKILTYTNEEKDKIGIKQILNIISENCQFYIFYSNFST